jgi:hypothetical protein
MRDLSLREWIVIGPICAMAIFMGVVPQVFLAPMAPAVERNVASVVGAPSLNAGADPGAPVTVADDDAPATLDAPGMESR